MHSSSRAAETAAPVAIHSDFISYAAVDNSSPTKSVPPRSRRPTSRRVLAMKQAAKLADRSKIGHSELARTARAKERMVAYLRVQEEHHRKGYNRRANPVARQRNALRSRDVSAHTLGNSWFNSTPPPYQYYATSNATSLVFNNTLPSNSTLTGSSNDGNVTFASLLQPSNHLFPVVLTGIIAVGTFLFTTLSAAYETHTPRRTGIIIAFLVIAFLKHIAHLPRFNQHVEYDTPSTPYAPPKFILPTTILFPPTPTATTFAGQQLIGEDGEKVMREDEKPALLTAKDPVAEMEDERDRIWKKVHARESMMLAATPPPRSRSSSPARSSSSHHSSSSSQHLSPIGFASPPPQRQQIEGRILMTSLTTPPRQHYPPTVSPSIYPIPLHPQYTSITPPPRTHSPNQSSLYNRTPSPVSSAHSSHWSTPPSSSQQHRTRSPAQSSVSSIPPYRQNTNSPVASMRSVASIEYLRSNPHRPPSPAPSFPVSFRNRSGSSSTARSSMNSSSPYGRGGQMQKGELKEFFLSATPSTRSYRSSSREDDLYYGSMPYEAETRTIRNSNGGGENYNGRGSVRRSVSASSPTSLTFTRSSSDGMGKDAKSLSRRRSSSLDFPQPQHQRSISPLIDRASIEEGERAKRGIRTRLSGGPIMRSLSSSPIQSRTSTLLPYTRASLLPSATLQSKKVRGDAESVYSQKEEEEEDRDVDVEQSLR